MTKIKHGILYIQLFFLAAISLAFIFSMVGLVLSLLYLEGSPGLFQACISP